jgi:dTDP-4-dehydrorhamnose 3,5-epimerase-like enzyme
MTAEPKQIDVSCHVDDRGFLFQIYKSYEFPGVKRIYVVGNFSENIVRGFHKHNEEWKGYFVVSGAAKFQVVDKGGRLKAYILSEKNPSVLVVPPKYSHGWVSLRKNTVVIGISDKTLEESLQDDLREDPFMFGSEIWSTKSR